MAFVPDWFTTWGSAWVLVDEVTSPAIKCLGNCGLVLSISAEPHGRSPCKLLRMTAANCRRPTLVPH